MNSTNDEPNKIKAFDELIGISGGGDIASLWDLFSLYHLFSAFHLSHLSKLIEEKFEQDRKLMSWNEVHKKYHSAHRSYVVSSILSSVAFLETTANEIFAGIADKSGTYYEKQLREIYKEIKRNIWRISYFKNNRQVEKQKI